MSDTTEIYARLEIKLNLTQEEIEKASKGEKLSLASLLKEGRANIETCLDHYFHEHIDQHEALDDKNLYISEDVNSETLSD